MKILFMRHGESKSQAKIVLNSDPDSVNTLTDIGMAQVRATAENTHVKIDAVYSSPYARAIMTAETFLNTRDENTQISIDARLGEINYGFHGGDTKKHPEMIAVATKQIAGDYEVRFGRTGENKREIVTRFFNFLTDVFRTHDIDDVVLAISHGRAISIIDYEFRTVNNMPAEHSGTKNAQIKEFELTPDRINKIAMRMKQITKGH